MVADVSTGHLRPAFQIFLLLESTHALDIQRMETVRITGLIRRKLILTGFQAHPASVADSDYHHSAGLALSSLVFLFRECDADLGNGARRGARGVFHKAALLIHDQNRLCLSIWRGGRNRVTAMIGLALPVVYRELGLFTALALATQEEKRSNQNKTEKNEDQKRDQEINHGGRKPIIAVVASDDLGKRALHDVDYRRVFV